MNKKMQDVLEETKEKIERLSEKGAISGAVPDINLVYAIPTDDYHKCQSDVSTIIAEQLRIKEVEGSGGLDRLRQYGSSFHGGEIRDFHEGEHKRASRGFLVLGQLVLHVREPLDGYDLWGEKLELAVGMGRTTSQQWAPKVIRILEKIGENYPVELVESYHGSKVLSGKQLSHTAFF